MRPASLLGTVALACLALGGCVSAERSSRPVAAAPEAVAPVPPTPGRYAALSGEPFPVASIDTRRIPERYLRQEVDFPTAEPAGTIVIDSAARHLYFVQGNGRAIRYGVGIGKEGMSWSGTASVGVKRSWPDWYPPKEMIARRPDIQADLVRLQGGDGVPGGPANPLGARALYLWQDGRDTLYRIHGTLEPYTMGQAVSSGCIRMINQDAIDLFSRVEVGTRVVVLPDAPRVAARPAPAEDAHAGVAVFPEGRPYQAGYSAAPQAARYGSRYDVYPTPPGRIRFVDPREAARADAYEDDYASY